MNTRKLRKVILTLCSALLLVSLSVGITLAYLTDTEVVKNTFTVGDVAIVLDEALVDENGKATDGERVQANEYHLLPNMTYDKDPMVTVKANSEDCYVRVFVTVTDIADVDKVFAAHQADNMAIDSFIKGLDNTKWVPQSKAVDADGARTFELRYYQKVAKSESDTKLEAIFTQLQIPGVVTNLELASMKEATIEVTAQAIQAASFADADAAWAAFPAQQ